MGSEQIQPEMQSRHYRLGYAHGKILLPLSSIPLMQSGSPEITDYCKGYDDGVRSGECVEKANFPKSRAFHDGMTAAAADKPAAAAPDGKTAPPAAQPPANGSSAPGFHF